MCCHTICSEQQFQFAAPVGEHTAVVVFSRQHEDIVHTCISFVQRSHYFNVNRQSCALLQQSRDLVTHIIKMSSFQQSVSTGTKSLLSNLLYSYEVTHKQHVVWRYQEMDPPDLQKAAEIYERLGHSCMEKKLLAMNAKGYWLQTGLCLLGETLSSIIILLCDYDIFLLQIFFFFILLMKARRAILRAGRAVPIWGKRLFRHLTFWMMYYAKAFFFSWQAVPQG